MFTTREAALENAKKKGLSEDCVKQLGRNAYCLVTSSDSHPMEIKDSGARREFETGAVRDIAEGKGRCDLLPLDVIDDMIACPSCLGHIETFKQTKNKKWLYSAIKSFCETNDIHIFTMFLEVSKHFEEGAKKYGENNWKKGIPLHCYIDSATRHYLKYLRGDTDEPHDRAFVWNLLCAAWTIAHKPELDDIEKDLTEGIHSVLFRVEKCHNCGSALRAETHGDIIQRYCDECDCRYDTIISKK